MCNKASNRGCNQDSGRHGALKLGEGHSHVAKPGPSACFWMVLRMRMRMAVLNMFAEGPASLSPPAGLERFVWTESAPSVTGPLLVAEAVTSYCVRSFWRRQHLLVGRNSDICHLEEEYRLLKSVPSQIKVLVSTLFICAFFLLYARSCAPDVFAAAWARSVCARCALVFRTESCAADEVGERKSPLCARVWTREDFFGESASPCAFRLKGAVHPPPPTPPLRD